MADELGKLLANNNFTLVHGGGMIGLMGALSRSVKKHGGKVIGVIPEKLNKTGIVSTTDDKTVVTADMGERKKYMTYVSDGFIALPGGFGTLEEILELITLKQLKYHSKPIVIINTNGFYDKLFDLFERLYSENFAKAEYRDLFFITDSPEKAVEYITGYKYTEIKDKWF